MDPNQKNLFLRGGEEDSQSNTGTGGYESQLSIQISPTTGESSISASRRRTNPFGIPHHPQMNDALICAQRERRDKLLTALTSDKLRLERLKAEVSSLRKRQLRPSNLEKWKVENQRLRIECGIMTQEVDLYDNGSVPLGETSEEFYRDINTGQNFRNQKPQPPTYSLNSPIVGRLPSGSKLIDGKLPPPPRPPPPKLSPSSPLRGEMPETELEWVCSLCTFKNHPDLKNCEQCEMVKFSRPKSPMPPMMYQ